MIIRGKAILLAGVLTLPAFSQEGVAPERRETIRLSYTRTLGIRSEYVSTASFLRVAVSPEGSRVAALDADRTIHVWDADKHSRIARFTPQEHPLVYDLAFLDDARVIVTFSKGDARVYKVGEQSAVPQVWDHKQFQRATYAPRILRIDAQRILLSGRPPVCLDAKTGGLVTRFRAKGNHEHRGEITAMALSPDRSRVYTAGKRVLEWDVTDGSPKRFLGEVQSRVTAMALNADGDSILSGHENGELRVWSLDPPSSKLLLKARSKPHPNVVWCGFRRGGGEVHSLDMSGILTIVNLESGRTREHRVSRRPLLSASHIGNEEHLVIAEAAPGFGLQRSSDVSAHEAFRVWYWDLTHEQFRRPAGPPDLTHTTSISGARRGSRLITTQRGEVMVWDVKTGKRKSLVSKTDFVVGRFAELSSDGATAYVASATQPTVWVWNVEEEELETSITTRNRDSHLTLSADSRTLACETGTVVDLYTTETRRKITSVALPDGAILAVALSPDGSMCAISDFEGNVYVWNLKPRKLVARVRMETPIGTLVLADDETVYAAGTKGVYRWTWKHRELKRIAADTPMTALTMVLEGILVGAHGNTIRHLDFATTKSVILGTHESAKINHLRAVDGGSLLVSVSSDGEVKVWKILVGE